MVLPVRLRPQLSERWVMYRMVCPLVDESCKRSGFDSYFEYALPSGPNRAIKVDVALLNGNQPVWYVEAKKFTRPILPDMVKQYLHSDVMGAVTNGNYWVFFVRGRSTTIGPVLDKDGLSQETEIRRIVALLACQSPEQVLAMGGFTDSPTGLVKNQGTVRVWRLNGGRGTRVYAEKARYENLAPAIEHALSSCPGGSTTAYYLQTLRDLKQEVTGGWLEVNGKRLTWWRGAKDRLCRIDLESKQLEMLVTQEIVDWIGETNITARLKIHDKNVKMKQAVTPDSAEANTLLRVFAYPIDRTLAPVETPPFSGAELSAAPEGCDPITGSDYHHHPEIWDQEREEEWLAEMKRLRMQERGRGAQEVRPED